MNRYRHILFTLVAALAVPQIAAAEDPQWSALLAFDDGGLAPKMLNIVADSETVCLAELSSYRDAIVIEPCQPVLEPSAITDDNDYPRSGARPRPRDDGAGGKGAGAGAGLGGVGHIGGG